MNNKRKIPKELSIPIVIGVFLLFLGLTGVIRPLRGVLEKIFIIPVRETIFVWQRTLKKDLGGCILTNERQLGELKVQIAGLKEENSAQKKLLGSSLPKEWKFQTVKVIGINGEELVINNGRKDNLSEGMIVVFNKTYLGKISKVSENLSYLRLPSYLDEKLAVKIVTKEKEEIFGRGLLTGGGTGKMKIEQIFLEEIVRKGDSVMLETMGGSLLVGEIQEVIEKPGEVFKSALVVRLFNPEELDTVFIVRLTD